jgi:DNA-binding response OmpR family regulator
MSAQPSLLAAVVEDELPHITLIADTLVRECGFRCMRFSTAASFLQWMTREQPDLIVLDWGLPDIEGIDVVRRLRDGLRSRVPVIFVTARGDDDDLSAGLAAGADDYLVKPLQVRQLTARVGAVMRRYRVGDQPDQDVRLGPLHLDRKRATAWVSGVDVALTPREFDLAWRLATSCGQLVSRAEIITILWGAQHAVDTRSLDSHIYRVRRKLHLDPEHGFRLSTVYGHGYRLEHLPPQATDDADAIQAEP